MTQTPRPAMKWRVNFPPNEKPDSVSRPCLDAVCYGNPRIADLLNYFVFEGSKEADRQKIDESCKVVTFTRTHEDILKVVKVSEKTLITYMKQLKTWGYVTSQPYRIEYTVNFELIDNAIVSPPAPKKRTRNIEQSPKGCKVVNLQPEDSELGCKVEELQAKVVNLQLQVEELQLQVVKLQSFAVNLQPYNPDSDKEKSSSNGASENSRLYDYKRPIETRESKGVSADASTPPAHNDTDTHSQSKDPYPLANHPKRQTDEHKAITKEMLAEASSKPEQSKRSNGKKPIESEIPPEAVHIMDEWDTVHKKPTPRTKKCIDAALLLVPFNPTREDLQKCERWLYTTDRPGKPWYRSHGVSLSDIAENISKWQSLQEAPSEQQNGNDAFVSKTLDKERNDRRIQEMIEKSQKIRAERAAQAM